MCLKNNVELVQKVVDTKSSSNSFAVQKTSLQFFFSRPSPLRLSPGRHTVFVLMNELAKCMKQRPSLGSQKRSADHYTVRSLVRPISEKQHKPNKPKNKQNTQRNRHRSKDSSVGADNLCANELRDLAKKKKENFIANEFPFQKHSSSSPS